MLDKRSDFPLELLNQSTQRRIAEMRFMPALCVVQLGMIFLIAQNMAMTRGEKKRTTDRDVFGLGVQPLACYTSAYQVWEFRSDKTANDNGIQVSGNISLMYCYLDSRSFVCGGQCHFYMTYWCEPLTFLRRYPLQEFLQHALASLMMWGWTQGRMLVLFFCFRVLRTTTNGARIPRAASCFARSKCSI